MRGWPSFAEPSPPRIATSWPFTLEPLDSSSRCCGPRGLADLGVGQAAGAANAIDQRDLLDRNAPLIVLRHANEQLAIRRQLFDPAFEFRTIAHLDRDRFCADGDGHQSDTRRNDNNNL